MKKYINILFAIVLGLGLSFSAGKGMQETTTQNTTNVATVSDAVDKKIEKNDLKKRILKVLSVIHRELAAYYAMGRLVLAIPQFIIILAVALVICGPFVLILYVVDLLMQKCKLSYENLPVRIVRNLAELFMLPIFFSLIVLRGVCPTLKNIWKYRTFSDGGYWEFRLRYGIVAMLVMPIESLLGLLRPLHD